MMTSATNQTMATAPNSNGPVPTPLVDRSRTRNPFTTHGALKLKIPTIRYSGLDKSLTQENVDALAAKATRYVESDVGQKIAAEHNASDARTGSFFGAGVFATMLFRAEPQQDYDRSTALQLLYLTIQANKANWDRDVSSMYEAEGIPQSLQRDDDTGQLLVDLLQRTDLLHEHEVDMISRSLKTSGRHLNADNVHNDKLGIFIPVEINRHLYDLKSPINETLKAAFSEAVDRLQSGDYALKRTPVRDSDIMLEENIDRIVTLAHCFYKASGDNVFSQSTARDYAASLLHENLQYMNAQQAERARYGVLRSLEKLGDADFNSDAAAFGYELSFGEDEWRGLMRKYDRDMGLG